VERAETTGPLRRGVETLAAVDLLVASRAPDLVAESLAEWPRTARIEQPSAGIVNLRLAGAAQVAVEVVSPEGFEAAWHHTTGSDSHLAKVLSLPRRSEAVVEPDERGLYSARGLPWIPPELREDAGEVEAARAGWLPDDLVRHEDLKGFVHCHTTHSDGRASIELMARAAQERGAEYITITDHSPAAFYANGVGLDRLHRQWDEIERVQERLSIRILRGTESDILPDGALDYPDAVLERMDVVIASIHARHGLDRRRMTQRIVRAMRQPIFKIWGHGLGRLIGRRPPVDCDVEAVLDAVAGSRAAIEVNGDPHRLDLEPRWLRAARERGIRFVISTDAHAPSELDNVRYGVITARRGWLRRGEVLNTLPLEQFQAAVRPARPAR
jgi:DNA polymerase (family 10)